MGIYALFIVNRSGGLIFHERYPGAVPYSLNDCLRLASTFHGIQQISKDVAPVESSIDYGIQILETTAFRLRALQSLTGIQFLVLSTLDVGNETLLQILQQMHLLYADYALKNPFYEHDMPIRCKLFEIHLGKLMEPWVSGTHPPVVA